MRGRRRKGRRRLLQGRTRPATPGRRRRRTARRRWRRLLKLTQPRLPHLPAPPAAPPLPHGMLGARGGAGACRARGRGAGPNQKGGAWAGAGGGAGLSERTILPRPEVVSTLRGPRRGPAPPQGITGEGNLRQHSHTHTLAYKPGKTPDTLRAGQ